MLTVISYHVPLPLSIHVGPVVSFLIVFPEDVLHGIVNFRDRFGGIL